MVTMGVWMVDFTLWTGIFQHRFVKLPEFQLSFKPQNPVFERLYIIRYEQCNLAFRHNATLNAQ